MVKIERYLQGTNTRVKASETKVMGRRTLGEKIEENRKDIFSVYGALVVGGGEKIYIHGSEMPGEKIEKTENYVAFYGENPEAGDYMICATTKYYGLFILPATEIMVERGTEEEAVRDLEKISEKYFPKEDREYEDHYKSLVC